MKEKAFYINKPKIIQKEVFAKEQNVAQLLSEVKIYIYIYIYTVNNK